MFSGISKKCSKIMALLSLMIIATVFAIGSSLTAVAEEFDARSGFDYVENGFNAYDTVEKGNSPQKQELLTALQGVSQLSTDYVNVLVSFDKTSATPDEALEVIESYNAFAKGVEDYNAQATAAGQELIAVPETVSVRTGLEISDPIATDVTGDVSAILYGDLKAASAGWESATEYDYTLKYVIKDSQDAELFNVFYKAFNGDPLIVACNGVEYEGNLAGKNLAELVYSVGGVKYKVQTEVIRTEVGTSAEDLSKQYEYSVKIHGVWSGEDMAAADPATVTAVIDPDYTVAAATVGELMASAKAFFDAPVAAEVPAQYGDYSAKLATKIEQIRGVAIDRAESYVADKDEALYTAEEFAKFASAVEICVQAMTSAVDYAGITAADQALTLALAEIKTIPEAFRADYAAILGDKIYITGEGVSVADDQMLIAVAAYAQYVEYLLVKPEAAELIAADAAQIEANVRNTANSQLVAIDKTLSLENYAENQIREIYAERKKANDAIANAGVNLIKVKEAVDGYKSFTDGIDYETVNEIENGSVKIVAVLDKDVELNASVATVPSNSEDEGVVNLLAATKVHSSKMRRLSVLEKYDITLSVEDKVIDYAGSTIYNVTVKMTEDTLNIFKENGASGIDPLSMTVACIGEDDRLEILQNTVLSFKYEDGTTVTYSVDSKVDWDKIVEGSIMFDTLHFSSYYLMGNTSNLAGVKMAALLSSIAASTEFITYILIGVAALVGAILIFTLIAFICSLCTKYKIKFVSNGGKKVKKIRRKYGKTLPELPVPTRDGYIFDGWCIDKTLKYKFNRNTMPRANTKLYARWIDNAEAEKLEQDQKHLAEIYDKLRAKLASYKRNVKEGEVSFIKEDLLAKLFAEGLELKLCLKTKLDCLKYEDGKVYIVKEDEKFDIFVVADDADYENAIIAIEDFAKLHGLVEGEPVEITASTYNDALLGYAYVVNYGEEADFDQRYCALRANAFAYVLANAERATAGKVLFELIPHEKDTLDLSANLDGETYSTVFDNSKCGVSLDGVFTIKSGEDMCVAFELIDRVMKDNGFVANEPIEVEAEFDTTESYQYIISIEEEAEEAPAEEPVEEVVAVEEPIAEETAPVDVKELFKELRAYVSGFALFAIDGEVDRSNDGKVILKARLADENIIVCVDPTDDADEFGFNTVDGLEQAKEKTNAVMAKYGLEHGDEENEVEDREIAETEYFAYRLRFPKEATLEEMFAEIRDFVSSFAMFVNEGEEIDTSKDGSVIVKANLEDEAINVSVDPDAEAQEVIIKTEADLDGAKQIILSAMAKYGMEVDPDYVPNAERAEGKSFGFRIKF